MMSKFDKHISDALQRLTFWIAEALASYLKSTTLQLAFLHSTTCIVEDMSDMSERAASAVLECQAH